MFQKTMYYWMIGEDDKVLLSPFKGFYHSPHEPNVPKTGKKTQADLIAGIGAPKLSR